MTVHVTLPRYISTELTNMIVAERTYEVDAKVITSSDNMLQALIQIQ